MKVSQYLKTHRTCLKGKGSWETVPTAYVVTYRIPRVLFEERGMVPDRKQRVHGFGTKREALDNAKIMKAQGGTNVRVIKVKPERNRG